jgi:hypothetical protein
MQPLVYVVALSVLVSLAAIGFANSSLTVTAQQINAGSAPVEVIGHAELMGVFLDTRGKPPTPTTTIEAIAIDWFHNANGDGSSATFDVSVTLKTPTGNVLAGPVSEKNAVANTQRTSTANLSTSVPFNQVEKITVIFIGPN